MRGDSSKHSGSSKKESATPQSLKKSHKRKRDLDGSAVATSTPTPTKKPKRSQSPSSTPAIETRSAKKRSNLGTAAENGFHENQTPEESGVSARGRKATSPSADDRTKSDKKSKRGKHRTLEYDGKAVEEPSALEETNNGGDGGSEGVAEEPAGHSKLRKRARATDDTPGRDDESKPAKDKFSGIRSKFEKSIKAKEAAKAKQDDADNAPTADATTAEPVFAKGLEPLPQPEASQEQVETPSYSSLPPWLANPVRASAKETAKFPDLGVDTKFLRILKDNGYKEAFAVQAAVIPLLLQGPKKHSGDLCISAATGSGKTLSYVLPLVTALQQVPAPRLRGLIVVPTRELVKQAREACELCAAGSGLRIGSAVGNVAIKDEQQSIMRVDQVYSPDTVRLRQQDKLTSGDWTNFSLHDYVSRAEDLSETLPGYIHKSEPNVDILICTPGRLVDHLRYTDGFTLKDLQWLVIDEADRLLNESFQEWVNVVMNSLDARKAPETFGFSGKFLTDLGLSIQTKEPRKVILSATMTRDISKLNSLRLANPKMVIVGSANHAMAVDENGLPSHLDDHFTLPSTLKEFSISIGDESKKPLYLLRLLLSHIKLDGDRTSKKAPSDSSSQSDESSVEDSDSDDTSSSGSSSDDSDSSSDEETSSASESDTSDSDDDSDDSSSASDSDDAGPTDEEAKVRPARNTVLIFTKSSESASRLSRLLSLLHPSLAGRLGTIIKSNKSSASRKTLTAYRQGNISIIVATDRASRGLDLPSLNHVINYDVPPSITTYVHRVGRTARAGKEGSAWTLIAHREGRWFGNEIAKGSEGKITRAGKVDRVAIKIDNMTDGKSRYKAALGELESEVRTGGKVKSAKSEA